MSALPGIPVDLEAIGVARQRLQRALELVTAIENAGSELAELVGADQADGATHRALTPVREPQEDEAPASPPSPPRPDPSPAVPPTADDGPPAATPAPQDSPPLAETLRRHTAEHTRDRVLSALRRLPTGDWQTTTDIAAEAGLSPGATSTHLAALVETGQAETNGKGGAAKRHRLIVAAESEQDGATPGEDDPATPAPAATPPRPAPRLKPPLSRRVAREIERERAERDRAQARALDPGTNGTLEGRITQALQAGPAGLRSLARRIGHAHPTPELVDALVVMVRHNDIRRFDNPRRAQIGEESPLFEVIA